MAVKKEKYDGIPSRRIWQNFWVCPSLTIRMKIRVLSLWLAMFIVVCNFCFFYKAKNAAKLAEREEY